MQLGQIKWNNALTAAIFEGEMARPIPGYTVIELIRRSEAESVPLPELATKRASLHGEPVAPVLPIHPPEVWACGCTYEPSAAFRDGEHGVSEGIYSYVYRAARPEIFFKGPSRICVGPGQTIGIRPDSKFTAPEPELALILGSRGRVLGYTLANDVSAWDIERENPLYLPQSKIYTASCALGPVIVTPETLLDPHKLEITCTIQRDGNIIFSGKVSTGRMRRRIEESIDFLLRANPVPAGSVLLTGTGIVIPSEAALQPGDVVSIRVPEIGELTNTARLVG